MRKKLAYFLTTYILLLLSFTVALAQPPDPPAEPAIPIDDGWWILALAGFGYGIRFYLKRKKG